MHQINSAEKYWIANTRIANQRNDFRKLQWPRNWDRKFPSIFFSFFSIPFPGSIWTLSSWRLFSIVTSFKFLYNSLPDPPRPTPTFSFVSKNPSRSLSSSSFSSFSSFSFLLLSFGFLHHAFDLFLPPVLRLSPPHALSFPQLTFSSLAFLPRFLLPGGGRPGNPPTG